MNDRKTFIQVTCLVGVFVSLPLLGMAANTTSQLPTIPQFPEPGHKQAFQGDAPEYSAFSGGRVDGSSAGRTLNKLSKTDSIATRGAKEAEVYHRISPSVVLVFTDDGLGSGALITDTGLIITNWHVINGFSKVGVIFKPTQEGARLDPASAIVADVIKYDQVADLALLKLETMSEPLPAALTFGDYSKVTVGDDVQAIGHPTGEMWTYTKGYVSQVRREYSWQSKGGLAHVADVIQTQTPINPGNSGGPLLDERGFLVGVNAFGSEGEGLNFAIGINEIQKFLRMKGSRVAQVAPSSRSKCETQILFEGRSKADTESIQQVDTNCNGKVDIELVIPDNKTQPIFCLIYSNETDKPNGIIFSVNRDEKWNISYWDSTGSGKWDTIGYHPNGDLYPSSYGPYTSG